MSNSNRRGARGLSPGRRRAIRASERAATAVAVTRAINFMTAYPDQVKPMDERYYDNLVDDLVRLATGETMPRPKRVPRQVQFLPLIESLAVDNYFEERMVQAL